ncbi:hypothetical protein ACFWA4_05990 [Streptomyces sp. NPDC060011]|uniref:zinc finger domain-containing protein n=1 Tax=Streptomyces sp. NPDC060011 TaxID=3347037 RepID=UPI003685D9F8
MAERIAAADISFRPRGAPRVYPWDLWMDGSMWHLRHGVDYKTDTKVFRDTCYNQARRHGRKVHTRVTDYGIVITFLRTPEGSDMACNEPVSRMVYDLSLKTRCEYCGALPGQDCVSVITDNTWQTDGGWNGQHQSRWALALRDHLRTTGQAAA